MRVAGTEIPPSAMAELAVRLHRVGARDLAQYIGRAVDNNRSAVSLNRADLPILLGALEGCPASLAPLRGALFSENERRQRGEPAG